jgi:hypothetical protein
MRSPDQAHFNFSFVTRSPRDKSPDSQSGDTPPCAARHWRHELALAKRGEGGREVVGQIRNSVADFEPLGASSALNDSVMIP